MNNSEFLFVTKDDEYLRLRTLRSYSVVIVFTNDDTNKSFSIRKDRLNIFKNISDEYVSREKILRTVIKDNKYFLKFIELFTKKEIGVLKNKKPHLFL